MYLKIFFNIFFILFIAVLQSSFVSALPSYFSNLNLVLLFLVFILIIDGLDLALFYAFAIGLTMDYLSFMPFGIYALSFIFMVLVTNFLLVNFFTNRSLYSFLALTASSSIINFIFVLILNISVSIFLNINFISLNNEFYSSAIYQLFLNSFFMIFVYYLTNYLSNSFRPVFLIKNKK